MYSTDLDFKVFNIIIIIIDIIVKITILVVLCWVVYFLLIYEKPISRDKSWYLYKINNFILNKIFIGIYIGIFLLFFTYLRIERISLSLDLNLIALKFNSILLHPLNRLFLLCLYILIMLIIIIIIGKINKFFIREIKKLHLYYSFYMVEDRRATYNSYHTFYFNFSGGKFCYITISAKFIGKIIYLLLFLNRSINRFYFIEIMKTIIKLIPILLIPALFFYDCYFNNFVITKVFYYLLFYMFYNIWYRVSTFLWYEEHSYGSILYEVYYSTNKISYCNVPEDLENIILEYMKRGLYNVHPSMIDIDHNEITPDEYASEIEKHRYFSIDGKKYKNPLTGGYYMIDNPTLYIPKNSNIFNIIKNKIRKFNLYISKIKDK